jgi:hypothetical protein
MTEGNSRQQREGRISRRELLRRGAIVGGTLVWATPALQSLAPPAYAQYARCGCCYCWDGDKQTTTHDACLDNGSSGLLADAESCRSWCGSTASGGPYQFSEYCSAATSCRCNGAGEPGENGCTCF